MPNDEVTYADQQPAANGTAVPYAPHAVAELADVALAAIDRAVPALEKLASAVNGIEGWAESISKSLAVIGQRLEMMQMQQLHGDPLTVQLVDPVPTKLARGVVNALVDQTITAAARRGMALEAAAPRKRRPSAKRARKNSRRGRRA